MTDAPDNLASLILEQLRLIRREVADVRSVALQSHDQWRRIDRRLDGIERRLDGTDRRIAGVEERISGLTDDLEAMFKAELMGRFAHFEIQIEARLDALADRVAAIEAPRPRA